MSYEINEIEGIGPAYNEKLTAKIKEVNEEKKLARSSPAPRMSVTNGKSTRGFDRTVEASLCFQIPGRAAR